MTVSQKKSGFLKLFLIVFMMFVATVFMSAGIHAEESSGYIDVAGNDGPVVLLYDDPSPDPSTPSTKDSWVNTSQDVPETTVEEEVEDDSLPPSGGSTTPETSGEKALHFNVYHYYKEPGGNEILLAGPISETFANGSEIALYPISMPGYVYNGSYDFSKLTYEAFQYGREYDQILELYIYYDYQKPEDPMDEEGAKVLEGKDLKEYYFFRNMKDSYGNLIYLRNDNSPYIGVGMRQSIDGNLVWCIEPAVATMNGAKYEVKPGEENIRASVIALAYNTYRMREEDRDLIYAASQGMIWETLGYTDVFNSIYKGYVDQNGVRQFRELTSKEREKINEFAYYVSMLQASYERGDVAEFKIVLSMVDVGRGPQPVMTEGIPLFEEGNIPEAVLFAGNWRALWFYSQGMIQAPEGVKIDIDYTRSLLIMELDPDLKAGEYEVLFSMVPENMMGENLEFVSQYGRQGLAQFKISKAIRESLRFIVKAKDKPTLPEEPEEPEKPNEPEKPEKPDKPKEEQPKEPEQDKPEEPNEPEKPSEAEKPNKPEKPNEPKKQEELEKPEQPKEEPSTPVSEIPTSVDTGAYFYMSTALLGLVGIIGRKRD